MPHIFECDPEHFKSAFVQDNCLGVSYKDDDNTTIVTKIPLSKVTSTFFDCDGWFIVNGLE